MAKRQSKKTEILDSPYTKLLLGLVFGAAAYGFGSWGIDSGSLWHYLLAFVSLYYAVHFIKVFIKETYFNNGKSKAKKA